MASKELEVLKIRLGLCADCRFRTTITSDRGSHFYQCQRSLTDSSFPKYPRLPVLQCPGHEQLHADDRVDRLE